MTATLLHRTQTGLTASMQTQSVAQNDADAGDDLTRARTFVDQAQADITALLDPANHDSLQVKDRLSRISKAAKPMHARAIDRAARTALDFARASQDFAQSARWQGQILVVNKLICQYAQGLSEVEAELLDTSVATESVLPESPNAPETTEPDHQAAYYSAKAVLMPLIKYAPEDAQKSALSRLASISMPSMSINEISESKHQTLKSSSELIEFEHVQDAFTQSALHAARQSDKIVSVSYGSDTNVTIMSAQRAGVETMLGLMAQSIVEQIIEQPDVRRERGDNGAAHIAVTASMIGKKLSVRFQTKTAIARAFHLAAESTALKNTQLSVDVDGGTQVITLLLSDRPETQSGDTLTDSAPQLLSDFESDLISDMTEPQMASLSALDLSQWEDVPA